MRFITCESYKRAEVIRWHERIKRRYTPPEGIRLTVFLPCSAKKPYSSSRSHKRFIKVIKSSAKDKVGAIHEVILTSPLGLVPRELEGVYPANSYDIPVTGEWLETEKRFCRELLQDYLKKAKVKAIAYVDGALREICEEVGIEVVASLSELGNRIKEEVSNFPPVNRDELNIVRKICDFQFGLGAEKFLIRNGCYKRGRQIFYGKEQIATINKHGYLSLTLRGGELLKEFGRYIVEVSFFPNTDNIFCVGIERADHRIRPNDEVIVVYNDTVVGVGRSVLCGDELERSTRGLGVVLRHKKCAQ